MGKEEAKLVIYRNTLLLLLPIIILITFFCQLSDEGKLVKAIIKCFLLQNSLMSNGSILTPTIPLSSICHSSGSNKSNKSLSSKSDQENNKIATEQAPHGVANGHHNDKGEPMKA